MYTQHKPIYFVIIQFVLHYYIGQISHYSAVYIVLLDSKIKNTPLKYMNAHNSRVYPPYTGYKCISTDDNNRKCTMYYFEALCDKPI